MICKNKAWKYYRFRFARFYGGIATADCVGCNLKCVFCWSSRPRDNPEAYGKFYEPEEVASKLIEIAKRKGIRRLRISGNEPTLCKKHLLKVIDLIPENYLFILETNGTLINRNFAKKLSKFPNLHVRVSIKGIDEEQFEEVTKRSRNAWEQIFRGLNALENFGVSYHVAIMDALIYDEVSFSNFLEKLASINDSLVHQLEIEPLIIMSHVRKGIMELTSKGYLKLKN